jgi:diguanylate cyclase (GGDEF)-like protein
LVLVAEHDIAQLEALARQMIGITDRMAETQRELIRTKKELERREAELERLVSTDPLTGLSNRRQFDERLHEEIERSERTGAPLSLVMLDLDRFKGFNDTWGHLAGDECLQGVASILDANSRPYDTTARFGGEEFILILPGTGAAAARDRAEALRVAIARMDVRGADERITASFGVAEYRGGTAEHVIRAADQALYAAKAEGRNRVRLA